MVDQLTLLNVGARWRLHADASLDLAGTRREREDTEEHELMLQAMLRW